MKKSIYLFASLLTIVLTIITFKPDKQNYTHLKADFIPESMDELQDNSQIILIGTFIKTDEIIEEDGLTFYVSEIEVNELIQGDIKTESVRILQTYSYEDPIIPNNGQVLLFLEQYSGYLSDDNNTYICKGLGYGQYRLDKNTLSAVVTDNNLLHNIPLEGNSDYSEARKNQPISTNELIYYLKSRIRAEEQSNY